MRLRLHRAAAAGFRAPPRDTPDAAPGAERDPRTMSRLRSPRPRPRTVIAGAVAAAGLSLAGAGTAAAADPILPLSDVRPGMVGEARTVVHGTDIATFPVTVIDVLRGSSGPGGTHILVRAAGPLMEETGGVADGMSGSPVSVTGADGVARVMGAIAFGSGDEGNVVVGVTPIEQMIDSNAGARANERGAAAPASLLSRTAVMVRTRAAARALEARSPATVGLYPLARWTVSGVSAPLARRLGARLAARSIRLTSIGAATPRPAVPLVPGASMSTLLSGGDVVVAAIGTVTYVDGPTVIGYGHSLIDGGRSDFLMADGYVHGAIPAPTLGASYKIAEPGTIQGSIVADRADAVTGRLGPAPGIAGVATASNPSRGADSTVRVTLAADQRTAPDVSSVLQDEPALRVTDGSAGGTLTLRISVTSPDLATPFTYRNVYAATSDLAWAGSGRLPSILDMLMRNTLRKVPVTSVTVDERFEPRVRAARIVAVGVRGRVRPGHAAQLVLRVQPYRASSTLVKRSVRLPAGVNPSSPVLRVVPKSEGGFNEPFQMGLSAVEGDALGSLAPRRPAASRARSGPRATGTRLERVMAEVDARTDDRHDAVRLLAAGDEADDLAAGITVPVPFVISGGEATVRVRFKE